MSKALVYAAGLCVRSEQCEHDIRVRLQRRGVTDGEADRIVEYLKEHRYLSDERYARAFVRTKSRLSGWGPWKIQRALAARRIETSVIRCAMEEVDADRCEDNAEAAARRKARGLDLADRGDRARLYRFLYSRGYGSGTIGRVMARLGAEQMEEDDDIWE